MDDTPLPHRARASSSSFSRSESDNASRVAELEQERDALKRDVEALCRQQAGYSGTIDVMARMQARKAVALEKELAECQRKVVDAERRWHDAQMELSEACRAKGQLGEQLTVEMQKGDKAMAEVKFFQSQVAPLLAQRDRALVEVEELNESCNALEDDNKELTQRIQDLESDLEEAMEAQERLKEQLEELRGGVKAPMEGGEESIRERDSGEGIEEGVEERGGDMRGGGEEQAERADISDAGDEVSVSQWRERARAAEERAVLTQGALEELMLEVSRAVAEIAAERVEVENEVGRTFGDARTEAFALAEMARAVVAQARVDVKDVNARLEELLQAEGERLREEAEDRWRAVVGELRVQLEAERSERERLGDAALFGGGMGAGSSGEVVGEDVLAQAMREKVQALLLLSQQEERHHLEMNTAVARLQEYDELKRNLSQVAREKVAALMQVAQLKREHDSLHQQNRELMSSLRSHRGTSLGGGMLPANWSDARTSPEPARSEPPTPAGPLSRSLGASSSTLPAAAASWRLPWLRTSSEHQTPRGTNPETATSPRRTLEEAASVARLRVENVALQEHVSTVRRLTDSTHRLRLALAQVAHRGWSDGWPTESSEPTTGIETAIAAVDAVASEARQLKIALGGGLPVSWTPGTPSGPNPFASFGSVLKGEEKEEGKGSGHRNGDEDDPARTMVDTASAAGVEMAELLLATAELQKATLLNQKKLSTAAVAS